MKEKEGAEEKGEDRRSSMEAKTLIKRHEGP